MDGRIDDQRLLQQDAALADLVAALDAADGADAAKSAEVRDLEHQVAVAQCDAINAKHEAELARRQVADGRNLEAYLDGIGREYNSGDYKCDLEKYWPYGPRRDFPNWGVEITDLSDPMKWSFQPAGLYQMDHDELVAHIRAEISRAMYYLLVHIPRWMKCMQFGGGRDAHPDAVNQHAEVVRMHEFVNRDDYRVGKSVPKLEELDDQQLRAVAFVVDMAFENLC
jgi:hypothetical protein